LILAVVAGGGALPAVEWSLTVLPGLHPEPSGRGRTVLAVSGAYGGWKIRS